MLCVFIRILFFNMLLKIGTLNLAGLSGLRGREVNSFLFIIIFGVFVMLE